MLSDMPKAVRVGKDCALSRVAQTILIFTGTMIPCA
jgi:hypothetical protein